MRKAYRYLAVYPMLGFVILLCLVLVLKGNATPFISSFAVDASDRIYVGTQNEIRVYSDGVLIDKINPQTSKSYVFTIDEDENILLSTSVKIYTLDLNGNILDIQEDPGADMYNQIQYKKRQFVSPNGDEYKLVSEMGWTRIVKNSAETVYRISLLSFVIKILTAVSIVALFVFSLWIVKRHKTVFRAGIL